MSFVASAYQKPTDIECRYVDVDVSVSSVDDLECPICEELN